MATVWGKVTSWLRPGVEASRIDARLMEEVESFARRYANSGSSWADLAAESAAAANPRQAVAVALGAFHTTVRSTLGLTPFAVQIHAAALLARGSAVEMQTGEGKTLTA